MATSFVFMGDKRKKYIDLTLAEMIAERLKQIGDEYGHTQELEFITRIDGEQEPIVTVCTIMDITNHYK